MADNFIIPARDPRDPDGPFAKFIIPGSYYERLYKYNPVKYENLRAAKYVLENTDAIFSGVRDFDEGGWCYVGRPLVWFIRENESVEFPENRVFAVYVNPNLRLYEHRAEYIADDDCRLPKDWQDRYQGLIWTRTS